MRWYRYRAINAAGRTVKGELQALHETDLATQLQAAGQVLVAATEIEPRRHAVHARLTARERMDLLFYLYLMLRAGVPLISALDDMTQSAPSAAGRQVMGAVRSQLDGGKSLAEAMASVPGAFGDIVLNLVRVGEATGSLPEVLDRIVRSMKWQDALGRRLKKALMYPAFVTVVIIGVVTFLMSYLVPQLIGFLNSMGREMPGYTKALLAVSHAFTHYWWLIAGLPAVLTAAALVASRVHPPSRYALHTALLTAPLIGNVVRKILLARLLDLFALMYRTGIPVLDALHLCGQSITNLPLQRSLQEIRQRVVGGSSLSAAFERSPWYPSVVISMLRVGENTGALDEALDNVAYFFQRDIDDSVDRLQGMIEPVMTVVLGMILGWIMLSVLGPIYDTISQLKF